MAEARQRGWALALVAIVTAVGAGFLSVWRLLLVDGEALSRLVWAEDGLFPLCARAHGFAACLVDPFSGYFLLLPRLVAWPVSLIPMDAWPAATNVAAAILAALAAGLAVAVLRASGCGWVCSVLVALLPTLLPIMGFEAINATGSSYMLLVFVAALAVCLPPRGRFPTAAFAIGAAVVALTIPSSAVLLLPLAVQAFRRRIPRRSALVVGASLVAGLVVQAVVAVTADNPRNIDFSWEALRRWAEVIPGALRTFWPGGTSLDGTGAFTAGPATELGLLGVGIAVGVVVVAALLLVRGGALADGVGLLLLVGLGLGALPAAAGYANNRYYVIPVLLWSAAVLVAADRLLPRWRETVMGVIAVALVLAWWPSLPAYSYRTTSVPQWAPMLAAARATCAGAPDGTVAITFTPAWPFVDAVFTGPTNNVVPCSVVLED